jgi:hypothetical protein
MTFFFLFNPKFFDAGTIVDHVKSGAWKKQQREELPEETEPSDELEIKFQEFEENSRKIQEIKNQAKRASDMKQLEAETEKLHAARVELARRIVDMDEEEAAALLLLLDS